MSSDAFDRMVGHTFQVEGGFSNVDSDPGGKTRYGITEKVARNHGYEGAMEDLPRELAYNIYRDAFFTGPKLDEIALRSMKVAREVFDAGVNIAPERAVALLQRALNLLNSRGRHYADIKVDGLVGPATLGALDAYFEQRPDMGEGVLLKALLVQRGSYYMDLAASNEEFEDFLFGWLRRRVDTKAVTDG